MSALAGRSFEVEATGELVHTVWLVRLEKLAVVLGHDWKEHNMEFSMEFGVRRNDERKRR